MEKRTKKEETLRCGFSRVSSAETPEPRTEKEALEIYKEPMLRYGIDCGCPFTEEEVINYITKEMVSKQYRV